MELFIFFLGFVIGPDSYWDANLDCIVAGVGWITNNNPNSDGPIPNSNLP